MLCFFAYPMSPIARQSGQPFFQLHRYAILSCRTSDIHPSSYTWAYFFVSLNEISLFLYLFIPWMHRACQQYPFCIASPPYLQNSPTLHIAPGPLYASASTLQARSQTFEYKVLDQTSLCRWTFVRIIVCARSSTILTFATVRRHILNQFPRDPLNELDSRQIALRDGRVRFFNCKVFKAAWRQNPFLALNVSMVSSFLISGDSSKSLGAALLRVAIYIISHGLKLTQGCP